ncbi:MAG TPA: GDSL-type esterase/lipase family protein, partial [Pyrinomonadaceae bacterium]|nr:GDSL-type esterase/lipase family protein [Pyrinomonadaceae bacterium]
FGGSEIADSTFYAARIVTPYRPRLVVLYAGDNDLANGKTPARVFADYKDFVAAVRRKQPATPVAFIAIKPSPARAHLMPLAKEANEMIKNYSSGEKNLLYIDVFTPMLGADGQPRPELFGPDRLHMNKTGYEIWRVAVAPYLR